MKKVLFLFIILISFTTICFAHKGRTDSNGGHWDRSTGTYHYHNGDYSGQNSNKESDNSNLLLVDTEETDREKRLQKEKEQLESNIESNQKIITNLENELNSKDFEIEKLKGEKTEIWIICGFIYFISIYVVYHIGKNKK